jgi:hypothetical protein
MNDVPAVGCTLTFSWLSFILFSQFSATDFKKVPETSEEPLNWLLCNLMLEIFHEDYYVCQF